MIWKKSGQLFAIRPSQEVKIGRLEKNPDKFDEIYNLGFSDATVVMGQLQSYLSEE